MCARLLCIWGPGSREMREFCRPELQELYSKECSGSSSTAATAEPEPLSVTWLHNGTDTRLAWVSCAEPDALQRAAASSATLLALVEVAADAPTLDAAVAQAAGHCPADWGHPSAAMRTLVLGSPHSKSSAERHLLRQLQQRLAEQPQAVGGTAGRSAGAGASGSSSSASSGRAAPPTLWALELQQQGAPGATAAAADAPAFRACSARVLLGVELARGGAKVAGRRRGGQAGGGPTQMKPELALATANLAAFPRGAVVLDPFCGTGTLLEAAAECGAGFVLGSDMEPALAGLASTAEAGRLGSAVAAGALAADASCLHLRPRCLDAILCDLPYGYRAAAVVAPAAKAEAGASSSSSSSCGGSSSGGGCGGGRGGSEDGRSDGGHSSSMLTAHGQQLQVAEGASPAWRRLLEKLLQLGGHALGPGGRLVVWMPHTQAAAAGSQLAGFPACSERVVTAPAVDLSMSGSKASCSSGGADSDSRARCSWLGELAGGQGLQLQHYLPETRQGGFPRAVAVLQKGARLATAWQAPRGKAAGAAPAQGGVPQRSSCAGMQPAGRQGGEAGEAGQGGAQPSAASQTGIGTCQGALADRQGEAQAAAAGCTEPDGTGRRRAAVLRRDVRYSQVRGALQGRDIDVWRASWLGDTAAVRSYLEAGGPADAQDAKGQTALQFAAGYGKAAVVELLLQAGADATLARDEGKMAPLHRAAARGHASVVSLLLRHRADPRQRSAAGQTPLMYAAQFGHRAALAALLQLLEVPMQGSAEAEASSKGVGASSSRSSGGGGGSSGSSWDLSSLQDYVSMTDGQGLSALHLAAQWGMADVVQDLVLGPGWDSQCSSRSALEACSAAAQAANGSAADGSSAGAEMPSPSSPPAAPVRQLEGPSAAAPPTRAPLQPPCRLADPNCRPAGGEGLAPAHLAARWGHVGVLSALWALGADLQLACLGRGRTPLQEAQEWSRPACVSFLESCREQGQG